MKRLLFLFLLLPAVLPAQARWTIFDTLPAGVTRIELPPAVHDHAYRGGQVVITNNGDYKALFADSVKSRIPKIDFTRYELLGKSYCMQCLITCHYHPQCHRNACRYTRSWFLMEKKQKIKLVADTLHGGDCNYFPAFADTLICCNDSSFSLLKQSCPKLKLDTIDFKKEIVLARSMYLDCMAQVEQEFFLDTVQKCLVWRLYTSDGGCRGLISNFFIFALPKPPDGYEIRFEEYVQPGKE